MLILVWLTGAGLGGQLFSKVSEVATNDQTLYLPESSDAAAVQAQLDDFLGADSIPAIVVWSSDEALDENDLAAIDEALADVAEVADVNEASPAIPSEDGLAAQAFIAIDADAELAPAVDGIRTAVTDANSTELQVNITGPAGFTADLSSAFAGIDGLLLLVALAVVLVILIIVYRSPLLPFIVLSTSLFALCSALLLVFYLAKWDVLLLSSQTQGILFILVIGAATDYSLLYTARYRETLRTYESKWDATWAALRGTWEPVLASGGTVIAGLLMLLFSDLKTNSTLGPVAAIGIVFAMLSALTLLPALLYWAGRVAFWPRKAKYDPEFSADDEAIHGKGFWPWLARNVRKAPRAIWIVTTIVLAVLAGFAFQLKAEGVPTSEFVLGESDARDGQEVLGEHFPAGSGSPAYVIVPEAELQPTADALLAIDGISSVSVTATDSPAGTAPVTEDGIQAFGPPGAPAPEPTLVDGRVMLQATLVDAADSDAAQQTVLEVRDALDDEALVGGVTATAIDTNETAIADRNLIIPIVLLVITLILMLLLRSIVAPLLLIATTVLSFGTAMGVAALLFNHVLEFPGADPSVPLYGFVFLVALGIDYNIFLMTRVREESLLHGTHEGVQRGLAVTGGVITSAGIVLAATFAALAVLPIMFLAQLAFIVAFGVLLDTFIVRSLLVPALVHDIGRKVWWPSKLARGKE
ncbi:MAG: MMPL family transporter [Microbacteriaceae bacterium]|nr:MMPL family transporter [Microbacteriaceae bacterium]